MTWVIRRLLCFSPSNWRGNLHHTDEIQSMTNAQGISSNWRSNVLPQPSFHRAQPFSAFRQPDLNAYMYIRLLHLKHCSNPPIFKRQPPSCTRRQTRQQGHIYNNTPGFHRGCIGLKGIRSQKLMSICAMFTCARRWLGGQLRVGVYGSNWRSPAYSLLPFIVG